MNNTRFKAKLLRRNTTETEQLLWKYLRSSRLVGFKFRRQVPIGPYIADFVCYEQRLIVECDGGQHAEREMYDSNRDQWLNENGYRVLRFWNNQILRDHETVLHTIYTACMDTPHPNPLPQGEREKNRKSR